MAKSRRNKIKWLFAILILAGVNIVYAQEFINTRKISLSRDDTTVVAGILADARIDEVHPQVFYYWYANGQVYSNQGGYSGNLLHGDYIEYDQAGKLIMKGAYERGLKSGQWIHWYQGGAIQEIIEYESGQLEGKTTRYTPNGRIHYSAEYRNDVLHGEMTTVVNDTLFELTYRNGIEKKRIPLYVFHEK